MSQIIIKNLFQKGFSYFCYLLLFDLFLMAVFTGNIYSEFRSFPYYYFSVNWIDPPYLPLSTIRKGKKYDIIFTQKDLWFCFQHKVKGSLRSESIVRTKRVCVSEECSSLSRRILQNIDPEQVSQKKVYTLKIAKMELENWSF